MRNFYNLKSIAIAIIFVILFSGNVFSQFANWHLNTDSSIYYTSGSVGIGVQNPVSALDVNGDIHFDGRLWSQYDFIVTTGLPTGVTTNWRMMLDQNGWLSTGNAAWGYEGSAPLNIDCYTTKDSDFVQPFARFNGIDNSESADGWLQRYLDINIANSENAGFNNIIKENDFSINWSDDNADNTSPGLVLAPYSNSEFNGGIRIDVNGKVGVGIRDPRSILDISGDLTLHQKDIFLDTTTNAGIGWFGTSKLFSGRDMGGSPVMYGVNGGALGVRNGQTENIALRWMPDTTNNTLVIIDGKLKAREVEVKVGLWPDYVFEKDYNLMSLKELEQYINANKHLPGLIPQNQAVENGVNVGDMQTVLLKKVEEMTLYIIELKKENDALKKRVDAIENTK